PTEPFFEAPYHPSIEPHASDSSRPVRGLPDRRWILITACQFCAFHSLMVSFSRNGWPRMFALLRPRSESMRAGIRRLPRRPGRLEGEWNRERLTGFVSEPEQRV